MKTDLGKLTEDWKNIDSLILYGAGIVGNICKSLFQRIDLNIPFVIDQNVKKQGQMWNDIPIISFKDASERLRNRKIVVMAGHDAYGKIVNFLNDNGLEEFKDFCNVGQFMSEWLWDVKKMNCVFHVDMTITTKCTLNCKHCNLFIPYHKEKLNFSFEELKENIDLFFERVDFVTYFGLIGGETFLSPVLEECITYLGEHYRNQIGRITVVTNGTVTPSISLLEKIKKYNLYLSISDYTNAIPYHEKMDHLIQLVQEYEIDYSRNSSIVWTDFGFPISPVIRNKKELEYHLECCRPNWNALHNGRFYYCNVAWSAEQSGFFKLDEKDYLELKDIDKQNKEECRKIVELSRGTSSFCKICGGCGRDNTNFVPTGVQMEKI